MLRIAEMQSRVPYNDGVVDYATDKVFCVQVSMPETANVRRAEKIIKRWGVQRVDTYRHVYIERQE